METRAIVRGLSNLMRLEAAIERVYRRGIEEVEEELIQQRLAQFARDHRRHAGDLSDTIRELGGNPPAAVGSRLTGLTSISEQAGLENVLRALERNEIFSNRVYAEAREWEAPVRTRSLVQRNLGDERAHLAYLRELIALRPWHVTVRSRLRASLR